MDESIITHIGELLALCGIVSFRSFLPTFLLLAIARLAPGIEGCPQAVLNIASGVPEVMTGNAMLSIFGVLAVAELVANWNDTMRQILEDSNFDLYFKPIYAFIFSVVAGMPEEASAQIGAVADATATAAAQIGAVADAAATANPPAPEEGIPWLAWVWNIISSGAAGFGTWALCAFRSKVAATLRAIDPDNTFHLHTLAKLAEETTWVSVMIVAILVPVLAMILVILLMLAAALFRGILALLERMCSHACASCGARVHNSAVVCPSCGKEQPVPYRQVGFFALASSSPVDTANAAAVTRHHRRLLSAHRCPLCASQLRDGFICGKCGAKVWEHGYSRRDLVGRLDKWVLITSIVGTVLSAVPILGFLVTAMVLNLSAIRVLRSYESRMGRIIGRFLFKTVKWTMAIFAIVFSSIPFIGIVFIVPYLVYYWRLRSRFLSGKPRKPAA